MRLLYIMDPIESILPDKDTTFAFLQGAQRRGHENFHVEQRHVYLARGDVRARPRRIRVADTAPFVVLGDDTLDLPLADFDGVLIRKDPPFDQHYLYTTLMLEHARGKVLLINDPRGLRDANEKLYALNFPEFVPRTLVSANREALIGFAAEVGGKAVIKPLDGAGGFGVMALSEGDQNARAIVDMLTREGQQLAMIQEYLPAVRMGDKRILLLDGEPLGAILRVPRSDDLRSNIHVGGSVVPAELTTKELAMVRAMAPRLRADGLVFVGLDVIGERLTEVNVTSPTGIQQLARFSGSKPEEKVIEWIEQRTTRR
ncbi:MAG TPA: glutathione synthase [Polyangiaceae bacterium]|nr:glutathione synthase [Polyangiaceae bacterium]